MRAISIKKRFLSTLRDRLAGRAGTVPQGSESESERKFLAGKFDSVSRRVDKNLFNRQEDPQYYVLGFTLIEVLVAMTIFSFIAVGTGGAINRGLEVKKRVEAEWDEIHGIRTAIFILNRDISLAFHAKKPTTQSSMFTLTDQNKWFKSYFIGKSTELNFTSLTHRRLYSGKHESDMCELGYFLDQSHLMRREDAIIDEDREKGGEPSILLEGVKNISFRFYSKKQDRWGEEWDTSRRDYEDQFPDAVEIKLTLLKNEKEMNYSTVVVLANPNNEPPKGTGQGTGSDQPPGPTPAPGPNPPKPPAEDKDEN